MVHVAAQAHLRQCASDPTSQSRRPETKTRGTVVRQWSESKCKVVVNKDPGMNCSAENGAMLPIVLLFETHCRCPEKRGEGGGRGGGWKRNTRRLQEYRHRALERSKLDLSYSAILFSYHFGSLQRKGAAACSGSRYQERSPLTDH